MCGIAGIYGSMSREQKEGSLDILSECLAHRGPDGNGRFVDDHVGLQHLRLSIIDLSANGNQPLYNEDKSLVLVCNGEIYNYLEIREELLKKGHRFSSNSDSEVILHLYEEYQQDPGQLLDRLVGMFAFALWDTKRGRLFIARDRVGIKPLYYSQENSRLLFSSEVRPIAKAKQGSAEYDYTSVYEYFMLGSIPGPNTLYHNIKCLEPGHYLIAEKGQVTIKEYWDIPSATRRWKDENEILEATEELLQQVIKDHLAADVPVGTFLSAGVDSSLITAVAVDFHPGIHSFTAAFPGEPEDEGAISAATAQKLGTTHSCFELKSDFFTAFSEQFKDLDQPFGIISALSLGRISKMARQQVKVVLSGDGGDELFGGYNRHEFPKDPSFLRYIPGSLRDTLLKAGATLTGKQSLEKLRQNLQLSDGQKFWNRVIVCDSATVLSLFPAEMGAKIDTERAIRRFNQLFDKRKNDDDLNRVLYVDMKTTLVDEMLTKCDRMTMINGIEGRVPFLDHRLVELAFTIPGTYKRKDGVGKLPLRNLLAKRLGKDLAFREKTGFNSPLKQWIDNDETTRAYIRKELDSQYLPSFIAGSTIKELQKDLRKVNTALLFSLVCVSQYNRN